MTIRGHVSLKLADGGIQVEHREVDVCRVPHASEPDHGAGGGGGQRLRLALQRGLMRLADDRGDQEEDLDVVRFAAVG